MSDTPAPRRATERELLRWAETLSATARTGLGFTANLYEQERFEEVLAVAADIRSHVEGGFHPEEQVQEWLDRVGSGVSGYVTPKITVGAVVGEKPGREGRGNTASELENTKVVEGIRGHVAPYLSSQFAGGIPTALP